MTNSPTLIHEKIHLMASGFTSAAQRTADRLGK